MALALHIDSRTNLLRESAGKIRFIGSINQDHLKRRNILDLYGAHSRRKSCTHPCWQQNYARITLHQVEGFMGRCHLGNGLQWESFRGALHFQLAE